MEKKNPIETFLAPRGPNIRKRV